MEPGGKDTVCVATVPSTMASPGPNKYLRKEWSKEGKKGGREGARAERKMVANPSPISAKPRIYPDSDQDVKGYMWTGRRLAP